MPSVVTTRIAHGMDRLETEACVQSPHVSEVLMR